MSLQEHLEGDCWDPCVWCAYEDADADQDNAEEED